jgi:histidinol-phosphatase (PHP family)
LREIFSVAARNGVGFEVNVSGLIRGKGFSMPEPELIGWFVEEGGEVVTVGSDSHHAAHTGTEIAGVYARLAALGVDWRTSFVGGQMRRVPLR